jgi:hypothetical protein
MIEGLAAMVPTMMFVVLFLCLAQVLKIFETHSRRASTEGGLVFYAEHRHSYPEIKGFSGEQDDAIRMRMTYLLASLDTSMTWSRVVTSKMLLLTINAS